MFTMPTPLRRLGPPPRPAHSRNPVLREHARQRGERFNTRLADTVTRLAGSMPFVYAHVLWFALWIGLGPEDYPFGLLTMIVSLEAILLTSFVLISQNRGDERRQLLADQRWEMVQKEEAQNEQLLAMSNDILELTRAVHGATVGDS